MLRKRSAKTDAIEWIQALTHWVFLQILTAKKLTVCFYLCVGYAFASSKLLGCQFNSDRSTFSCRLDDPSFLNECFFGNSDFPPAWVHRQENIGQNWFDSRNRNTKHVFYVERVFDLWYEYKFPCYQFAQSIQLNQIHFPKANETVLIQQSETRENIYSSVDLIWTQ